MYNDELIKSKTRDALRELLGKTRLEKEDIVVVGCSTSEVVGKRIGKGSDLKVAEIILPTILSLTREKDLFLAVQCCEHINRALIVEKRCAEKYDLDIVSVIPHVKAGGSMGQVAMERFENPVVVESIKSKARAGIDIGDTLIGMHLKRVVVPARLSVEDIGKAHVTSAYTRPPLIGGARALYK